MSNVHVGLQGLGGTIDHSCNLARDIRNLYNNEEYSDVVFKVNGHKFPAHKVILASRSQYFRALLYGGLKESHQDEVEIQGVNHLAFGCLLKYIYTGEINLITLEKEDFLLELLSLAHQYGFEDLESAVCDFLKSILCTNNICIIYEMASLYNLSNLSAVCNTFIDINASKILEHESFSSLSPSALQAIMKRDSFCANEIQIFSSVREWHKKNPDVPTTSINNILSCIRLPLINLSDLLNIVRPSGLITPNAILDAIKDKSESKDTELQYRGYVVPGENVAVSKVGAVVLLGEMRSNLLDGNVDDYDMDRGFTRHAIDDNNGQGILIKLGRQCIINHMRMLLWDRDYRSYSYYIQVSMDQKDWVRVVDYTMYPCRSWQFLYFPTRVVRFIKIVGTHNSINRVFHCVAVEAYYTKEEPTMHKGLICPKSNVALVSNGTKVIEGVSRAPNNLLNGNIHHYDWDSGYTCHQLGSGAICIQLGQPYWLSSCKLLLWDCDNRSYSYFIEVSTNYREWDVIANRTRETCRSWQTIEFTPRTVVYFKIVGTFNTANEVFHLVHFECPAQEETTLRQGSTDSIKAEKSSAPLEQGQEASADAPQEAEGTAAVAVNLPETEIRNDVWRRIRNIAEHLDDAELEIRFVTVRNELVSEKLARPEDERRLSDDSSDDSSSG